MAQKKGFFRRALEAVIQGRANRARIEAAMYLELYERADRD